MLPWPQQVRQISQAVNRSFQSYYQPFFPSTICFATSSGKDNPFMSKSVIVLHPSMQASNGEQQMYQPAQKNPTGQAMNISTRNQMTAQRTFIFQVLENALVNLQNDRQSRLTSSKNLQYYKSPNTNLDYIICRHSVCVIYISVCKHCEASY